MKKRVSLFLVLAMLVTAFGGFSITASAEVPAGYTEISSAEDFVTQLNATPSGKFYLTANITLGTEENPIQTPITDTFQGTLSSDETNRKTITMYINDTKNQFAGLFSWLGGDAVIENIELAGMVKATGTDAGTTRSVGALAGKSGGTVTVSNCVNRADVSLEDVTAWGCYAAGFIGNMYAHSNYGTLTKLVNKGNISCLSALGGVGGIVGITTNDAGTTGLPITGCENYGTIRGKGSAGGIVGYGAKGIVQNGYNGGTVTGSPAGGIFGFDGALSVKDCYNIGSAAYPIGSTSKDIVSGCSYLDEYGTSTAAKGTTPKTLAELKAMTDLPADFRTALNKIVILPEEYADYTIIQTPEDFQKIVSNGKYYLANDIDLTDMDTAYKPIEKFTGCLVGADAANPPAIKMNIKDTENKNVGLFRVIGGGVVIKNIQLTGSVTASGSALSVGALAGNFEATTASSELVNIINRTDVTVTATAASYVGGLFGGEANVALAGKMSGFVNYGTVKTDDSTDITFTGGIIGIFAGWASSSNLTGCKNFGTVSGSGTVGGVRVGGIVGSLKHYGDGGLATFAVTDCYNGGTILGGGQTGGIAGELMINSKLENCYNTGDVIADVANTGKTIGGMIGNLAANAVGVSVSNCYNAGTVAGTRNVHPFLGQVTLTEANGTPFTSCGYLAADFDDSIAGTEPMTLAQMKALPNAPQEFIAFLDSIRTVTVEAPANGTLTPSGIAYVEAGSDFSVTAAPAEGYRIANVKANGTPLVGNEKNVYTTTINGDVTITAEFEKTAVVPTIVSPAGGAFVLTDSCGSITFGTVSGVGYEIVDYGICYSKTSQEPTEKLSANTKALVNGQFGVKLLFAPALETGATYYTRPYVTYANESGEQITVYGDTVTTTIQ